jgi:uncharacterized LabA/DUF88 family protein
MTMGTGSTYPGSNKGDRSETRVAVFIDGSNLYHALRDNFKRVDLNFADFINALLGQRRLFRTYYYNVLQDPRSRPEGYSDQQEFLDVLRKTPYLEVRLGTTKLLQGIPVEKGIDIMLATDLLYFGWINLYDVAILVSGDGDFAYALQAAKNMGKHVEVAYFESNISKDLLDVADSKHLLDRNFFKSMWRSRRPRTRRPKQPQRRGPQEGSTITQPANAGQNTAPNPV